MFCISVSYKKTPIEIRERFSFSEEERKEFLEKLKRERRMHAGVILSTCNRSEIYFTGGMKHMHLVECALAKVKGIEAEEIKKHCLFYEGESAAKHLFRVAGGLDSMVLGEDEILHQLKEAYLSAAEEGFTDGELNMMFQSAFNYAKLAKSSTKLSTTPVSIGTLTANEIERYIVEQKKKAKEDSLVMVIGATGKTGSIVAKDLLAKGISVLGTERHHSDGEEIYQKRKEKLKFIDFQERYQYVAQADAIVSATTSPHYTLTKEAYRKETQGSGERLLVDLAVPCDMDKSLEELFGVTLLDIDYFEKAAKENQDIKLGEAEKAKKLLNECVDETMKKFYLREFKEKLSQQKEEWFEKMLYYLKEVLECEDFLTALERIYEKETGDDDGIFPIFD